jgi:hypothetical protein
MVPRSQADSHNKKLLDLVLSPDTLRRFGGWQMKRETNEQTGTLSPQEWDRVTDNLRSLSRELNRVSDEDDRTTETRDRNIAAAA